MPWLTDVTFGYLVATPECRLEVDDLGIDQACVYDARRVGTELIGVVSEVPAHWRARMGRTAGTDLADDMLRGGLAEGVWRVFTDPNQALFGSVDQTSVQRWLSSRPAIQRLSRNSRSTQAISLTVSALTGVPMSGGVEGAPRPEIPYVAEGGVGEAVLSAVERLGAQGLDPEEIIVLTPHRLENSVLEPVWGDASSTSAQVQAPAVYDMQRSVRSRAWSAEQSSLPALTRSNRCGCGSSFMSRARGRQRC